MPTREVFDLYLTYRTLPLGQARLDFRARYPELDAWMLLTGKVTQPIGEKGKAEAPPSPWEEIAEKKRWVELLEGL